MQDSAANNRRIAKNTIYIYIRTIVVLVVSLYTSRIVLEILGADDYGIYTLVGGIIALMGFFQSAQSKATSRFITFELGKNGIGESLKKVFAASMSIHIIMALVAVFLCETIGLWIICHWTKIPPDRQTAAIIVYQFSILVFCIHLIRIPYDSVVIAHEEMSVFAYFSIIEVALQLGLVFILKYTAGDSLVLYAGLMALSALILLLLYYAYVRVKYPIYSFKYTWDKNLSKRMLSFSGWTLLGSGSNALTQQGVSLLMNNFVGLVANAAMGLSNQVNIAVIKFIGGFSTAFTPQVIKLYAQRNYSDLNILISRASKFSFALCYIMVLPLFCNIDKVLEIWLGSDVPEYTAGFCRMILIGVIFDATSNVFNTAITATGRIKAYQIWISVSFALDLLTSYILLYVGINPVLVFISRIATRGALNMIIGIYYAKLYINYDISNYVKTVILKILLVLLITAIPTGIIYYHSESWSQFFLTSIFSIVATAISVFYILMTKSERHSIMLKIGQKLHHGKI